MTLIFLTPDDGIIAAVGVLAIAALFVSRRRARRARKALRLHEPRLVAVLPTVVALTLVAALLGLALAQPVLRSSQTHRVRKDAEALFILDISGSMAAASAPGSRTRLERALRAALKLRLALQEVPAGIATMTDRVLPVLFPTTHEDIFTATLLTAIGINGPPPRTLAPEATTFAALDALEGTNFFDRGIQQRLAIVFTDGETAPYDAQDLRSKLLQPPRTRFIIIRYWQPNERIFDGKKVTPYRPNPASAQMARTLAAVTGGRAFDEGNLGAATQTARKVLGRGPLGRNAQGIRVVSLSSWLVLATFVPLGFLLWRRNLV